MVKYRMALKKLCHNHTSKTKAVSKILVRFFLGLQRNCLNSLTINAAYNYKLLEKNSNSSLVQKA